jgi:hypothetical protein
MWQITGQTVNPAIPRTSEAIAVPSVRGIVVGRPAAGCPHFGQLAAAGDMSLPQFVQKAKGTSYWNTMI